MANKKAQLVLAELTRKLLLLGNESNLDKRLDMVYQIIELPEDVAFEDQCILKQLRILLGLSD